MPQFTNEETKAESKLYKMKLVSGGPRVQTWTCMAIINYTTLPLNTYWFNNIYNLLSPYQMFSDGLNSLDYFIQMSQNSESSFYQGHSHHEKFQGTCQIKSHVQQQESQDLNPDMTTKLMLFKATILHIPLKEPPI